MKANSLVPAPRLRLDRTLTKGVTIFEPLLPLSFRVFAEMLSHATVDVTCFFEMFLDGSGRHVRNCRLV